MWLYLSVVFGARVSADHPFISYRAIYTSQHQDATMPPDVKAQFPVVSEYQA